MFRVVAVTVVVVVTLGAAEVAVRIRHGKLFSSVRLLPDRTSDDPMAEFDPDLGWVPRPGSWTRADGRCSVGPDRIRSNGREPPAAGGRPWLCVGDSMTFGDEVADDETWPSRLESRLGRRVVNAGVFAYGVDQAVLRAERLLEELRPETVLVALIADDVRRVECSYYQGSKPWFAVEDGRLVARNVPVVPGGQPDAGVRTVLGRSLLAHSVLSRVAPGWWFADRRFREHGDGVEVSARLLVRLEEKARGLDASLSVVALGSSPLIGSDEGLPEFVSRVRREGIEVLDVATAISTHLGSDEAARAAFFRPRGHYSPAANAWVADWIAQRLRR